jgi:hypothetical protein
MDIDTLTIGDAKKAVETGKAIEAALGTKTTAAALPSNEGLCIVILDRGFVYVGDVTMSDQWCVITNAKNVRRWGTTQGLGELAAKGPQPETKLDIGGTVKAPARALIGLIKCDAVSWNK